MVVVYQKPEQILTLSWKSCDLVNDFFYLIYSSPVPAPDVSDLQGFWEWYNIFIYVVRLEITSYFIYEKDKDILHSV